MFEARLDQGVLLKKLLEVCITCSNTMAMLHDAFLQEVALTHRRLQEAGTVTGDCTGEAASITRAFC